MENKNKDLFSLKEDTSLKKNIRIKQSRTFVLIYFYFLLKMNLFIFQLNFSYYYYYCYIDLYQNITL